MPTHQPPNGRSTAAEELTAMRKLDAAVAPLHPAAQARAIGWLADRYNLVLAERPGGDVFAVPSDVEAAR